MLGWGGSWGLSRGVEMGRTSGRIVWCGPRPPELVAEPPEHRLHRRVAGEVVDLAGIVALVEQLLAPVALVANVDEIPLGQRDQRAAIGRRAAMVGVLGVRPGEFRED